jgi:PPP family 3-phenylpropionic acid transporter
MSPAVLIGAFYFCFFGALGTFLPYFSLWLVAHGLSPSETTRVISLTQLMSMLAPPLIGLLADARRARVWLLRGASLGTALAFLGFFGAHHRPEIYLTTALFSLFRAPLTSLADATALDQVRRTGGSYGRLRLWGSLGFLVAVVAAGALLQAHGLPLLVGLGAAALGLSAACAFAMPAPPPLPRRDVLGAWLHLLGSGDWWIFFLAVVLAQLAMAAYDSAFSLHLARLGFRGGFIGVAWATGVAAEIALLALSARIVARVGAPRLFAATLAIAVVRWALLSRATSPLLILCLQPLHGITFGLYWVSAVTMVRARGQNAPTAAQGLFAAAVASGSLIGMNLAGALLEAGGGRLLFGAAAVAATGATACAAWCVCRPHRIL